MATKHTDTCLKKAADDEPIFVLRGQDVIAPIVIRTWIGLARWKGCPESKLDEAEAVAVRMEAWPTQKNPD